MNFKCPDCGSTSLSIDPTPSGSTFCKACSCRGATTMFVVQDEVPRQVQKLELSEWIFEHAPDLNGRIKRHVSRYVESSEIEALTRLIMISVREWAEEF